MATLSMNALKEKDGTNNFKTWSTQLINIFKSKKINYLFDGEKRDAFKTEQLDIYEEHKGLAMYHLSSGLEERNREYIDECTTVKEAYDKLKSFYVKPKSSHNLDQQLHNLTWDRTKFAEVFINKLNNDLNRSYFLYIKSRIIDYFWWKLRKSHKTIGTESVLPITIQSLNFSD